MSHEDACQLIVPYAGTQFDPDVVDAFIEAEEEVLRIREVYSDSHILGKSNLFSVDAATSLVAEGCEA